MRPFPRADLPGTAPRRRRQAFTLVELIVSASILALMTLFLVTMTNQASSVWSHEQAREQHRQRARAALEFIERELRAATLPVVSDTTRPSLQLVISPSIGTETANHDSIFWQAPIASEGSKGNLAEVGYFVRWNGTHANLCRFFVNPSDSTNYLVYSNPTNWLNADVLNAVAPATKAGQYRGLFLENVIGMWVQGHVIVKNSASPPVEVDTDFSAAGHDARFNNDSRPNASRTFDQLPAYVEISLALLDPFTATRVQAADVTTIQSLAASSTASGSPPKTADVATAFVQSLPAGLRPGASVVNLKVNLGNYHANYE